MPLPVDLPAPQPQPGNGWGAGDAPAGARFRPDPRLLAQGWDHRFVAGGPRLKESLELYEALGLDVLAEPLPPESFPEECEGCQLAARLGFRMIYTRRRSPSEGQVWE
ncbi:MAG: hypothetical protein A2Z37_18710 [Chloroflexi bacterium RBG_19FT_COMBO_62_14]|nr:MAG: hypothetical protein A2Z37_18710 [Chloroflexi bacterium RBG_19FT_COMBO_62_14]